MFRTFIVLLLAGFTSAQQPSDQLKAKLGYPPNARLLIIHADDFGMAHTVNRAITAALENGWVTSASIMVPCPWFPEVATWAKAHPNADLGIHLVLDSEWQDFRWSPISGRDRVPSLLDPDGYFFNDPDLLTHAKINEIDTELRAQIEAAKRAGIHLSHLDSHMAALIGRPDFFQEYAHLGHDFGLPIQLLKEGSGRQPPRRADGHSAAEGLQFAPNQPAIDGIVEMEPGVPERDWFEWYKKQLSALKPGIYQMIVHLAYDDEEFRGATHDHPDWGAAWRQSDLDMVRSPVFRQFLKDQGFILVSWKDLTK